MPKFKTFDVCDYCKEEMQVLWAISIGRATVHLYSNLSELYSLRDTVDEMIENLEAIQKEKNEESMQRRLKKK